MKKERVKKIRTKKYYVRIFCVIICAILILTFLNCTCWVGDKSLIKFIKNYSMPSIAKNQNVTASFNQDENWYELNNASTAPYKILQISDLHLGCGFLTSKSDKQVVREVYKAISINSPDLVVVTGDALSPLYVRSGTKNSYNQLDAFIAMMEKTGVYWTYCFGNHDSGGTASKSYISKRLEGAKNCLYTRGEKGIGGYGNFAITLKFSGEIISSIILLDTGTGNSIFGYKGVTKSQIEWYEKTVNALKEIKPDIKTHLYMHAPFKEYSYAYKLAKEGEKAQLIYGEKNESISATAKNGLYDKIAQLDSTKWVYCGHDHYNSFSVLMKDTNVRLTYGMSIDYATYVNLSHKKDHRGVTLTTIGTNAVSVLRAPRYNGYVPIIEQ